MLNAQATFEKNLTDVKSLSGLYSYLTATVRAPFSYDDLLRSQIVYAVSAFDKLMHDIIRKGMVEIFTSKRPSTTKYQREAITLGIHSNLVAAMGSLAMPPAELVFEQEITQKLSFLSFQDPDKIADGLSLIWDEKQKWQKIAAALGKQPDPVRTQLKLICARRNAIVHEADMHPVTSAKTPITEAECNGVTSFLGDCGKAIVGLVI